MKMSLFDKVKLFRQPNREDYFQSYVFLKGMKLSWLTSGQCS